MPNAFSAVPVTGTTAINSHGTNCLCGMSRRRFLSGAMATAALAGGATAQPAPRRIDVHHHVLPPNYIQSRLAAGTTPGTTGISAWTPARTLAEMDKNGVATAVLSLSQPGVRFDDIEGTRSMLRYCNEYGAQLVRDHPGRFGLFATLPLADIDGSLRELEYAFDVLKADGVGLLTSYGTRYPGHAHFEPVFAELNRRKAVAFFHPNMAACCVGILPDVPGPTIEYQFNTARTITNLLFTGTLNRFPDIKYIFCHSGGAMTPQMARIVRHAEENKTIAERLPNGALAEIKKLYYDCAQATGPHNLGALKSFVPMSHIVFGSDYPFVHVAETLDPLLKFGLSEAELGAVTRANALALFPRLNAT
jgi:6-methylsalicylate decarboxylase